MAENIQRSKGRAAGYKFDRGGMPTEFGPFVGTVKNNVDPTRQGRLQVYIEQFAGLNPEDPSLWRTVNYCPPFFGTTPLQVNSGSTSSEGQFVDSNPQSYGMWFTPPDLGTQVLCFFVAGDPNQGYYIGCLPNQGSNHMVPAVGSSKNFKYDNASQKSYFDGAEVLPVTEINPNNVQINNNPQFFNQKKPVHSVLAAAMFQQGTIYDPQRGPIGSSSQRESPSGCYGIATPGRAIYQGGLTEADIRSKLNSQSLKPQDIKVIGRRGGHTFVMDDGDLEGNDNLIRIRTSKGHQITMSDDGNFFYLVHANGQTWIEMGQEGTLDVYATNSVNVRTQGTINLHADEDINMFAGGKFNIKSVKGTTFESDAFTNVTAKEAVTVASGARVGIKADGSLAIVSNTGTWDAGGSLSFSGGAIDLNGGPTESVDAPEALTKYTMPDTEFNSTLGWGIKEGALESIVTRAPTHEPWPYHNQGVSVQVKLEEGQPTPPPTAPEVPEGWSMTKTE